MKEVILASGSENRRKLMESLGVPFRVVTSNIDEQEIQDTDPLLKVEKIAQAKAHAVKGFTSGIIIAADTISIYNGKEYPKPTSKDDARRMLRGLSGQNGMAITGVCILDIETQKEILSHTIVNMSCEEMSDEEINVYVENKPVTEWAAAYNPLDELSLKYFHPIGEYLYKLEYYGLGIDILLIELRKAGFVINEGKLKAKNNEN